MHICLIAICVGHHSSGRNSVTSRTSVIYLCEIGRARRSRTVPWHDRAITLCYKPAMKSTLLLCHSQRIFYGWLLESLCCAHEAKLCYHIQSNDNTSEFDGWIRIRKFTTGRKLRITLNESHLLRQCCLRKHVKHLIGSVDSTFKMITNNIKY